MNSRGVTQVVFACGLVCFFSFFVFVYCHHDVGVVASLDVVSHWSRIQTTIKFQVEQLAAEFLSKYITENVGPFGAIGRMPLGLAGSLAGVPGIGPGGETAPGINKPELLGGLAGLGISSLFG